jgi:hypothetical protein
LAEFISKRKPELEKLRSETQALLPRIERCFQERSLSSLEVRPAARGFIGLPKLLYDISKLR